ncbi:MULTISPECIES: hypothetical protein [Bacteroides]|nr:MULTISPECIES: hypothetical protein [Bacteroides]MBM6659101.1 hypothetical protein [Bacteroides gallinaceum]OUO67383.1 hypothetical protein B5F71_18215 [Bacteroides sp. An269]
MKPNAVTCLLLIFCVMNLFFGCSQRKAAPLPELERAEAVMFDHPDSALRILESMPMPTDKEQHALWCLLVTQAKYKQYLPIPSDSLIRIAYDYYKPTDDARCKAMSALYMGGVNYRLQKIETATAYYLEAEVEVEKTSDYKLGYLVMSGLGNLYLYRHLTDYALEVFQKAYDYAVKDSNKRYEMNSLRFMARYYSIKKDYDQSIIYYKQASSIADSILSYNTVKSELAGIYSVIGDYDKALSLEWEAIGNNHPTAQSYYGIGVNYMNLHQYDSAYYYLNQALNTSNVYTRMGVYRSLLQLGRQPQYHKYIITYSDSLRFYEDSVRALDKSREIIFYKEKFEKEQLVTQNQRLELEKAYTTRLLLLATIVALVLLMLLVAFYLHRKIALRRKEEELNSLTFQLHENELLIDRNNNYIAELKEQVEQQKELVEQQAEQKEELASLHDANEQLRKENIRLNENMKKYTGTFPEADEIKNVTEQLRRSKQREEDWFAFIQKEYPFLSNLHQRKTGLDYAEEQTVYFLVDTLFDKFTKRLTNKVSLPPRELLLCCLIKLRLSVGEIAVLMNLSPASVSTAKQRIKNKIHEILKDEPLKRSFDLWIWEY